MLLNSSSPFLLLFQSLFNLAISLAFGAIDYDGMEGLWPMKMLIDYGKLEFVLVPSKTRR